MRLNLIAAGWAVCALGASACGYKAEIAQLETFVSQRDARIGTLEAQVRDLEGVRGRLDAQVKDLEAALASKEAERAGLAASLAKVAAGVSAEKDKLRAAEEATALKDAELAQMRKALEDLLLRKRQAEARVQQFRDLVERFRSLIDAGTLQVRMDGGRMVLVLATDVLFAPGSADLSAAGKIALADVAAILGPMSDRRFQVAGHTDGTPINTARYPSNWFLASARAINVVEHLLASGMSRPQVSAASYGDALPVADNATPEGRAMNRRIEIVVVPDLSQLPGFEELNGL
ncbi:MAG: hypothetical protein RLZZ383_416 [Pseudomonadota bacterium]|jgi:chemotaxis protein MotB